MNNVRRRFTRVSRLFIGIVYDFFREYRLFQKRGYAYAQKKMARAHAKRAARLYRTAVEMGGVLIKLCQYFSTRRDVFPEEYVRALAPLQDSVPPVPFNDILAVVRGEYADYEAVFSHIEEAPLASASLGQTHRARLSDGSDVVIKVMKPGVERQVDIDFAILTQVFSVLGRIKALRERVDLAALVEEFIIITGDELNFRREVYVANRFRESFSQYDFVTVPRIFDEHCTGRVIVMEFCAGDKIDRVDLWRSRNNDPAVIARRLIELYVDQVLSMPYVHYDPHPGNILVTDNNCFILLDYGMSGEISEIMRGGLEDILEALMKRDYRKIVDTLYLMGFIRRDTNRYALLPMVEYFFGEVLDVLKLDRESIYSVDLTPVKDELVEIIYTQPFRIPLNWAYTGKTLSTIWGLVSTINPDFNVNDELATLARRVLGARSSETVKRAVNSFKETARTIAALPGRVDSFVDNVERGYFKIKVDYTEITEKIDEIKVFLIRLIAFLAALACGLTAYVFHCSGQGPVTLMFIISAAAAFLIALLYRKNSARERIKRRL